MIFNLIQVARSLFFDNSTNGFTASDVQGAIEELRKLLNFSYNTIKIGEEVTIPTGQQMRVYQELQVYGDLNIYGEVIVKDV